MYFFKIFLVILGLLCFHICTDGFLGDLGLIPGLGRSSAEGNGSSLQYSCLENSWQATVHEVTKSWTQLSDSHTHTNFIIVYSSSVKSAFMNTAIAYQVNLLYIEVKSLSCVQLCDTMDCRLPASSVHGIFQARILEWVAISLLQVYFIKYLQK